MNINYTPLLEATYQSILDSPIEEIPYWQNIADNLLELKKQNPILVSVDMGNEIDNYVFRECLEAGLSEVEFYHVKIRFNYYMKYGGISKETALEGALIDFWSGMDLTKTNNI